MTTPTARSGGGAGSRSEDPFHEAEDASRDTCEIRPQRFGRTPKPCDATSKPKRRKVDLNPQERKWLAEHGYTFARVELPTAFGSVTKDLFGVFDYLAVHPEQPGTLYVQVTTPAHRAARRRKVLAAAETAVILAAQNRVELHIWDQPNGVGTRWRLTVEVLT